LKIRRLARGFASEEHKLHNREDVSETTELELWFAYPQDTAEREIAASWASVLSQDELHRLHQFRFQMDRARYLAAHALLRIAVSRSIGMPARSLRFKTNEHGKPSLDHPIGVQFNLSHTRHLAACVISHRGEIGLDVEGFDRSQEIAEVGSEVFSATELAELATLSGVQRDVRRTQLWTLKEAYVKALGVGLSIPTNEISFSYDTAQQIHARISRALDAQPGRWRFCLLEHEKHSVCLVVENADESPVSMCTIYGATCVAQRRATPAITSFRCEKS